MEATRNGKNLSILAKIKAERSVYEVSSQSLGVVQMLMTADELANFVKTVAEKHPLLSAKCGKGMKLRRYWLDVDFPTHPPPEFERTG